MIGVNRCTKTAIRKACQTKKICYSRNKELIQRYYQQCGRTSDRYHRQFRSARMKKLHPPALFDAAREIGIKYDSAWYILKNYKKDGYVLRHPEDDWWSTRPNKLNPIKQWLISKRQAWQLHSLVYRTKLINEEYPEIRVTGQTLGNWYRMNRVRINHFLSHPNPSLSIM